MTHRRRPAPLAAVALLVASGTFAAEPARAALVLVFEPAVAGQTVVPAGANVAIDVVLRGERAARIDSAQFDVGAPANGAAVGANAAAADRFDESALLAQLDQVIDGSLLDDATLAFGRSNGTGIPAGTGDVRIGTFYLQTPGGVASTYSVTPQAIEIADAGFDLVPTAGLGTTITTVVPEPAALAAAALAFGGLLTRRRR
jgi:hypothetical protein